MVTRRQSREWALQLLVQFDLNPPESVDTAVSQFWEQQAQVETDDLKDERRGASVIMTTDDPAELEKFAVAREFTETRVKGAWREHAELERKLEPFLNNWAWWRLGSVERAALILGAWELEHCPDIPAPIVINEAVDLAKWFSETKSGRFVNGVLDSFAKAKKEAARDDG